MVFPDDDYLQDEDLEQRRSSDEDAARRRAIGRAAVAATLAATLAAPGAVLAAEITEPDPVPIVQVVQLDDPPDLAQAAVSDEDQDKERSGLSFLKKLLIGFAVLVLLVLLLVVTRCAGSFFGLGDAVGDGSGADEGPSYAITLSIDDSVARADGQALSEAAVSVSKADGDIIVERVEVAYGERVHICDAPSGAYTLIVLEDPLPSQGQAPVPRQSASAYRIEPAEQSFEVNGADVALTCTVVR